MERINHKVHLSYKDVLLVPYDDEPCQIKSRNDPDISSEVCPGKKIRIPILSAPMESITELRMVQAMDKLGCLGIHTRYINCENELTKQLEAADKMRYTVLGHKAMAIGVKNGVYTTICSLADSGIDIICLDIANGNHIFMIQAIEEAIIAKKLYPKLSIIAGNVATPKAAIRLAEAGADAVKIGIGPGGACTTRRVTGFGVPQLTAIMNCAPVLRERNVRVIADGGIRSSGDVVKALWAGADTVMMGYILAGHDECPCSAYQDSRIVNIQSRIDELNVKRDELIIAGNHDKAYDIKNQIEELKKQMENLIQELVHTTHPYVYRGMSSRTVSQRSDVAAEGVCFEVSPRGSVSNTINEYAAAIRAACSMANALNLQQLRRNVHAIRVSTMSQEESDPVGGE